MELCVLNPGVCVMFAVLYRNDSTYLIVQVSPCCLRIVLKNPLLLPKFANLAFRDGFEMIFF